MHATDIDLTGGSVDPRPKGAASPGALPRARGIGAEAPIGIIIGHSNRHLIVSPVVRCQTCHFCRRVRHREGRVGIGDARQRLDLGKRKIGSQAHRDARAREPQIGDQRDWSICAYLRVFVSNKSV
jgi:hypothetical protein